MSRVLVLALELLIVTIAVLLGAEMASEIRIIPKALLHLPDVDFSAEDTRTVLFAYLVGCGLSFLATRLFAGWGVFREPRRTAKEIYALLTGIVAAALYLFFLTPINFSPELLLDSSLIAFGLFILVYLGVGLMKREGRIGRRLGAFFANLFGLLRSPWAWLVVLFALSPVIVARQYVADRDFANWVTQLRVAANVGGDHPYELVNALGTTTFETPIMAQFAKSDPNRIYVLTRNGKFYRADYPSGKNVELLLDIAPRVGYVEMENGALGFDLHPEFGRAGSPNAGFAYIYYTEYRKDGQTNHLTRYDLSRSTPAERAASALSLIEQGRNNDGYHNAGMVQFGPDGFLYLSVGEASMHDCHQRIDCALVGGILRIDVDQRGGTISRPISRQPKDGKTANYYIPLDNPYANRPDALGEFYAHGMRNPFRFAFDPADGMIWTGDVGSTMWEEVNRVQKGHNGQFPYIEGYEPQPAYPKPNQVVGEETPPVLTYKHTAFLRSIIGGSVYRADKLPELKGRYIFADNYSGEIMTIPVSATRTDKWDVIARAPDVAQRGVTSLVVAPDGNLLITMMGDNDRPTGIVARLVKADTAEAEQARDAREAEAAKLAAAGVSPDQARSLYNVNCARCHGASGKGDGPDSQMLGTFVPDFTDANFHKWRTDEELLAAIHGGGMAVGRSPAMPPWEGVLNEAEMAGMKDYVRSFNGKGEQQP